MSVIDLATERVRRAAPMPDLVRTDEAGRRVYFFSGMTQIGDRERLYAIWAASPVEVARRIHAMRQAFRQLFGRRG